MGAGIARHDDRTDHWTVSAGQPKIIATSTKTDANGKKIARVGDLISPHFHLTIPYGHATITSGSSTVFVEGKAVARIGDSCSCPCIIIEGSSDTFSG